ncbi:MAG: hypothetical protein K2X81_01000 [Candidatus Obscuribacterales bacterium]|nr:hypothetical protein [Candidatus Obscuribacterales bacterium]
MATRATSKKTPTESKSKTSNALILKNLPLELLTPEQFEAVTKANYHHPESRLILLLFLQTNYLRQLACKIQNKPESISSINWSSIERSTAKIINESLEKLLNGIDNKPWKPTAAPLAAEPASISKPARKAKTAALKQACGCTTKHSNAAGVVAACQLGKDQGRDESWTGY